METPTSKRFWTLAPIVIVLAGVAVRWWRIGSQCFWFDEGYTAWMITHGPREIIRLIHADTAPPGYYLALWAWTRVFGDSEAGQRSLSALAGCITLLPLWGIVVRAVRTPQARCAAMALACFSTLPVEMSGEARSYAVLAMLAIFALWGVIEWIETGRWAWLIMSTIAILGGVYINNVFFLYAIALAGVGMSWPGQMPVRRRILQLVPFMAVIVVGYLPWLASMQAQTKFISKSFWVPKPSWEQLTAFFMGLAGTTEIWRISDQARVWHLEWGDTGWRVGTIATVGALVLLIAALARKGRTGTTARSLAILAIGPIAVAFALSAVRTSILLPKAYLASNLVFGVLLAMAFDKQSDDQPSAAGESPTRLCVASRWALGIMIAVVVCALISTLAIKTHAAREDWRGAAQWVAEQGHANQTLIVLDSNDGQLPFDYYYNRQVPDPSMRAVETGAPAGFFDRDPPQAMLRVLGDSDLDNLRSRLAGDRYQHVILVLSHTAWCDPGMLVESYMKSRATPGATSHLASIDVECFDLPAGK